MASYKRERERKREREKERKREREKERKEKITNEKCEYENVSKQKKFKRNEVISYKITIFYTTTHHPPPTTLSQYISTEVEMGQSSQVAQYRAVRLYSWNQVF
jgi:hypothetical protein